MRKYLFFTLLAATLSPNSSSAAEAKKGWSGSGELGLAIASGNTDNTSVVGKLSLAKEDARWKHAIGTSFLYAESNDLQSARRYEFSGSSGYRLGERSYVIGSIRNERDHFASDEYQWTLAAGYGYETIKTDATHLTFEIGPGYRWSKLQGIRVHNNEGILRGSMEFGHKFNESTAFYDNFLVEAGKENTYLRNELGLEVKMTDALALKAGLEIRHNTDVLAGADKTDTLTTLNVVYGF